MLYGFLGYLLVGIVLLGFLYIFWKVLRKVVVNSLVGLFLLFVLKYAFGIPIPINYATIAVTALFGLAGVGSLLILSLGGMLS
ncbi:MAG: pro-sigmaK processing inhibitor BofA family protein [Candidatus Altiarchaeota archaeon]|nr:pro-sigmaK processing inhibitor BofA family protein [Candidatus Altiarchaeota archaeon]